MRIIFTIGLASVALYGFLGLISEGGVHRAAASRLGVVRGIGVRVDVDPNKPLGSPLRGHVVMTQGYGVGTHAPAAIWGGVDLAIDGDGDGFADPGGTKNAPAFATHDGTVSLRPNTWPAGNYLSIVSPDGHWRSSYSHLDHYAVDDGAFVRRGDIVGYVGSTGNSSGPHLHFDNWLDGVNVNPLDQGAMDVPED